MDLREALLRIGLAILLGGIIGFERQLKHRAAGLRTHILVCLGACLVMIVSGFLFEQYYIKYGATFDPTHIGAQVVSGIGFLGAGTIIYSQSKVQGLTTAASLWAVACVGLVVGSGLYLIATVAAVLIYIILFALTLLSKKVDGKFRSELMIAIKKDANSLGRVILMLNEMGVVVENLHISKEDEGESSNADVTLSLPSHLTIDAVIGILRSSEGVIKVESVSH